MKFSDVESDASKYGISVQGYNNAHSMINQYKEAAEDIKSYIGEIDLYLESFRTDFVSVLESQPESAKGRFKDIYDNAVATFREKHSYLKGKINEEIITSCEKRNQALKLQGYWEDVEQNELTSISNAIDAKKAAEEQARIAAEQAQKAKQAKNKPKPK